MENFEVFAAKKAAVLQTLQELKGILDDLSAAGIDVADDLARLGSAVDSVQGDVLRIALLGAFSDGKTSVVAGLSARLPVSVTRIGAPVVPATPEPMRRAVLLPPLSKAGNG